MEVTAAMYYHSIVQNNWNILLELTDSVEVEKGEDRLKTGYFTKKNQKKKFMNSANKTYPWEVFSIIQSKLSVLLHLYPTGIENGFKWTPISMYLKSSP